MVYRSLGRTCSQAEVRSALAPPRQGGSPRTRAHLLCQDALRRRLQAVIVRVRSPWEALKTCVEHSIRALVNHRLKEGEPAGHYSVLVAVDEEQVVLNDPLWGPGRRLSRDELLRLWAPAWLGSEIAGHVLLAVGSSGAGEAACSHCHTVMPGFVRCRWCWQRVPLQPAVVLGCGDSACPGRRWDRCHCPWCDQPVGQLAAPPRRLPPPAAAARLPAPSHPEGER